MKWAVALLIAFAFLSCQQEEEQSSFMISQDRFAGIYQAFHGEFVGYDSNRNVINDTIIYRYSRDTLELKVYNDVILLSGDNIEHEYLNNGNPDSVRFSESLSGAHYEVHGYVRTEDSLFYTAGYTNLESVSFKGRRL